MVRAIDTPDDHTAVVHLKQRFAPFVNTFFAESDQPYDVVPSHVLSKFPNINQLPFNNEPTVSDGPFLFASWQHGDRIVMTANPKFFKGKPGLDRVEVRFVPDDNTSINLLRTHEIDYILQPSINTYPALEGLPYAKSIFVDQNGYEALQFNVSRPGISDPLVRRAIAYALDKSALVARLTHSQAKVATEDVPDWLWAFDPTVKSYPYDVSKAKQMLARAGWEPGPDGIVRKDGAPLSLLLSTDNQNATHREESLLIQEALSRIGIEVEIKYYPQAMLYATAALGGILQTGKFDLSLAPWYAGVDPDDSSEFLCGMQPPNGYNTARYCNPDMEAAQHTALTTYEIPARKAAYSKIQHLLARDNPYVFFWWQRTQEAISVDFKGFSPNPVTETWNAWQWSI
jgi:peptide/nickel transport system substrate-binding protein